MLKRCGKFMADWRDEHGIRHGKALRPYRSFGRVRLHASQGQISRK